MKIALRFAPFLMLAATAASAAQDAADAPDLMDVQAATCAQFARAQAYAKPPQNATPEQTALAELSQDDLVLAMTWVNGYLAGRDGASSEHAFTKDWIVAHMGKMNAICKAGPGSMLLTDVAAKL